MKKSKRKDESEFVSIRPCGPALFELVPQRELRIDLVLAAELLMKHGFEVLDCSELVLSIRRSKEINLYPHGRMIVYPANIGKEAEAAGNEILAILVEEGCVNNQG